MSKVETEVCRIQGHHYRADEFTAKAHLSPRSSTERIGNKATEHVLKKPTEGHEVTGGAAGEAREDHQQEQHGLDPLGQTDNKDLEELERAVLEADELPGPEKCARLKELFAWMVEIDALTREKELNSWLRHTRAPPGAYPEAEGVRVASQYQSSRPTRVVYVTVFVIILFSLSIAAWFLPPRLYADSLVRFAGRDSKDDHEAASRMRSQLLHGCDTDCYSNKIQNPTYLAESLLAHNCGFKDISLESEMLNPESNSTSFSSTLTWVKRADNHMLQARLRLARCTGFTLESKGVPDADMEKWLWQVRLEGVGQGLFSTWPRMVEYGQEVDSSIAQMAVWLEQVGTNPSGRRCSSNRRDKKVSLPLHRSQQFSVKVLSLRYEMVHVIRPLLIGVQMNENDDKVDKHACPGTEWGDAILMFDLAVEELARAASLLTHAGHVENRLQTLVASAVNLLTLDCGTTTGPGAHEIQVAHRALQQLHNAWSL